ncbi:hypothetical protein [Kineococcus siccus]|uniref:hypothetical protein n=1 Tax=Kineococcus siccus TaxID=2696567 RepID=UPI0030B84176
MRAPRVLGMTALLPAAALLASCGGSPTAASPDPTSTATVSESAAPVDTATPAASPSTSTPPAGAPAAGLTAAGTELPLGGAATLPAESSGSTGTFTVSVDSIERGTDAELAELELGDKVAGMAPYYVRYTVTGGQNAAALRGNDIAQDISALLPDGSEASPVILFRKWDRCASGDQGVDFAEGSTYQTCRVFVAPSSVQVTKAEFSDFDGPYDPYDGEPVTWG